MYLETKIDSTGRTWYKAPPFGALKCIKLKLPTRTVALWKHHGQVYALDSHCYHASGPLEKTTDIEDIQGQPCIRCPLHKYVISLSTGESFYKPVKIEKDHIGKVKSIPLEWTSKGVKQRKHLVQIDPDQPSVVWISLNTELADGEIESDKFNVLKL